MSTPPLLAGPPVPAGNRRHRDPMATLTAALLVVLIAGLFVLAFAVVTTHGITAPDDTTPAPADTVSSGFVAPFALALAILFLATIGLNVLVLASRHFRRGVRA